ncbi:GNAT family N-acetyltransferase [Argonema antarcticum]|uniref:GNAT family N-acetyltransferase n=1 Tax=Argonema antarcticum TaxID=2942763 RepID=UPI002012F4E8|nr:GNAT family N-acetyltransferase [Argonema antarcticum]MCL1469669.1 GNAT family N-acetyltransferase [Argonema antarcticum A004/B2]
MEIIDLTAENQDAIEQTATLLFEGFKEHWPDAWPNIEAALEEVQQSLAPDRISRIAVDNSSNVLAWIGGISQYNGKVWEVHPLVVRSDCQRQGIGKALLADLEAQVSKRGGITIWVGTDDEDNLTTLSAVNLYPNVFEHIVNIKNLRRHPYEFYQKYGFVIVGVMPDANGLGKPDIYMAKRVGTWLKN